ncbi:hypothetical protein CMV_001842 [Castanea mollissima]|uniref:Uncharacterized protein n=1 Tax=Castanea mollissima TaxID=60419 RepID=A0A8J4VY07_9ROSI|nr:hypothetical protein CMV_001842 [Castanea mollissima]
MPETYSESSIHKFIRCHVARTIRFGCNWGLHLDLIWITNNEDIAKLFIDPLANVNNTSLSSKLLQEQSTGLMNT